MPNVAAHSPLSASTEVNAWSGGGTLYAGPFISSYRYTRYHTVGAGESESHLLSVRLKDGKRKGYTQVFACTGTGAYTYDWTPETRHGKLHSLSVKRSQPLTERLRLDMVLGKQWFETPVSDYSGINIHSGVVWFF